MEPKKFSLKPIETQLLQVINQQHSNMLSNALSFFAIERLAVPVDANTRFDLSEDMKEITITQVEPPAEDIGLIEQPPTKEKK
jgi:hypothetical protein